MTQTAERVTTQAVDCVDLSYRFATHLAVDHVNLSIAPGEMYGLLGHCPGVRLSHCASRRMTGAPSTAPGRRRTGG
jgi:hypothetical protein